MSAVRAMGAKAESEAKTTKTTTNVEQHGTML